MIDLRIGRHIYTITNKDIFFDNGACVRLMTQSKRTDEWGPNIEPTLSKAAIKKISKFKHIQKRHRYGNDCKVFSLDIYGG